jgi:hypothetical protein
LREQRYSGLLPSSAPITVFADWADVFAHQLNNGLAFSKAASLLSGFCNISRRVAFLRASLEQSFLELGQHPSFEQVRNAPSGSRYPVRVPVPWWWPASIKRSYE